MGEALQQTDEWLKASKRSLYRISWGNPKVEDGSAPFLSFVPLLRKYLDLTKPKMILEWGPGASTEIMTRRCPNALIHSIEHDIHYYAQSQERLKGNHNIHIYFIPLEKGYSTAPLRFPECGQFDFVFVDGRRRVECLKTGLKVTTPNAVIMLHDSERPEYTEGKRLFRIVEESDGTAVMRKIREVEK